MSTTKTKFGSISSKSIALELETQAKIVNIKGARYEDIGLINYQLKLIEKNMPFINRIFLLVSNKEQVPANISDKVKGCFARTIY